MSDAWAVPFIIGDVMGLYNLASEVIREDCPDTFISPGYLVVFESWSPAEGTLVFPD